MRGETALTKVFFYHNAVERLATAAALISKAALQKKSMLVYAPDESVASMLDRLLWTHPPIGFVPHVRAPSPLAAETPVVIADNPETSPQNERLFNLSAEVPPGFSRFTSLIELIDQEEATRRAGRERARFYKDRGYELQFIDLAEKD